MWLLFVPLLILAGLILMGSALVGAVFGLLGPAWPLVLIAVGAWMFWREDRPRRQQQYGRAVATCAKPGPRASAKQSGPVASVKSEVKPAPPQNAKPELPIDVQVKVEQIRRKVEVLLGFADRFPPFSQDLFLVRQTASEYLPRTIDTFLGLPRDSVDKPLTAEGKTPLQELKTQLDLLDAKLDEIAQALQRQDMDRLLANRRFLEERFGRATA
ncbi:MAG: hypothetical protein JOZ81_18605 [Chloroflexi bacterium]|nr:hypothetical protein [Chloroflexota bacterium]